VSETSGSPKWRAMVLRASAAIAASAALICASQHFSPDFMTKSRNQLNGAGVVNIDQKASADNEAKLASVALGKTIQKTAPYASIELPAFDVRQMTLSQRYIEKLKVDEGKRLVSYLDNGKGSTWTIGYGHTGFMPDGRPIGPNMRITEEEADALLLADLQQHVDAAATIIDDTPVTQAQFEALVDFSYNKGPEALETSRLLQELRAGDYIASADQYLRWTKVTRRDAQGNPVRDASGRRVMDELPGLVRRAQEKRAEMLSAFSPQMIEVLDKDMEGIKVVERSIQRSESRLQPVRLTGARADQDALALEKAASALDKH